MDCDTRLCHQTGMEAVPGCNHLYRRGAVYWFRRRVPKDVAKVLGETQWRISLGTKDFDEAKRRARLRSVSTDQQIAVVRARNAGKVSPPLSKPEAEKLAQGWLTELLEWDEAFRVGHPKAADSVALWLEEDATDYRKALATLDTSAVARESAETLAGAGLWYPQGDQSRNQLAIALLKARVRLVELMERRLGGEVVEVEAAIGTVPPAPQSAGMTVSKLISAFKAERAALHGEESTDRKYSHIFAALEEVLGPEKSIRAVTRADVRKVRSLLQRVPKFATRRYPGLTLTEAADRADEDGGERIAPTTVNTYIQNLAAVFNWAVSEELLDRNPLDNRKENLRVVTHQENCRNRGPSKSNRTGHLGVSYDWRFQVYAAHIDREVIGHFPTLSEAITDKCDAYLQAFSDVAQVTIPDCDPPTSRRIAEEAIQAAINTLHLLAGAYPTEDTRAGGPAMASIETASIALKEDGKILLSWKKSWEGAGIHSKFWATLSEPQRAQRMDALSVAISTIINRTDPQFVAARFLDAVAWYSDAVRERSKPAAIVKYLTAMERLLWTGETGPGVTRRLSERTAALCFSAVDWDFEQLEAEVREAYDLRSGIVHGRLSATDPKVMRNHRLCQRVARDLLLTWLDRYGPGFTLETSIQKAKMHFDAFVKEVKEETAKRKLTEPVTACV